jgi:hypothetical protein
MVDALVTGVVRVVWVRLVTGTEHRRHNTSPQRSDPDKSNVVRAGRDCPGCFERLGLSGGCRDSSASETAIDSSSLEDAGMDADELHQWHGWRVTDARHGADWPAGEFEADGDGHTEGEQPDHTTPLICKLGY